MWDRCRALMFLPPAEAAGNCGQRVHCNRAGEMLPGSGTRNSNKSPSIRIGIPGSHADSRKAFLYGLYGRIRTSSYAMAMPIILRGFGGSSRTFH